MKSPTHLPEGEAFAGYIARSPFWGDLEGLPNLRYLRSIIQI